MDESQRRSMRDSDACASARASIFKLESMTVIEPPTLVPQASGQETAVAFTDEKKSFCADDEGQEGSTRFVQSVSKGQPLQRRVERRNEIKRPIAQAPPAAARMSRRRPVRKGRTGTAPTVSTLQ